MTVEELVDKPWSYVIGFCTFLAQIIVGGYAYSIGIFYEIFTETFEGLSPVLVAWLSCLPICTWFVGCPLGSLIIQRYGVRSCSVFGGLTASLGWFMCFFSTHFVNILICYGVICGLGHGIMYTGFVTAVNSCLRKYRAPITILCTLGPYTGMSCYSFLVPYLKERYSLRGTFVILSGIALNSCVCACALFSVPSSARSTSRVGIKKELITKHLQFSLFSFQNICCNLSNSLLLIQLPAFVLSRGFSISQASLMLTAFGLSNCAAKLIYAFGGNFFEVDVVLVYTVSLTMCGLSTLLIPTIIHFYAILLFAAIAAFFYNVTGGHNFLVIQALLGQDGFADGIGICFIMKSFGVFLTGPVAGVIQIVFGRYDVIFYVSGCVMLIGCSLMVPVCVHQLRTRKTKSDQDIEITENSTDVSTKMLQQ